MIPNDLLEADELMRRYGQWSKDRRSPKRCGSAEKNYRPPRNDESHPIIVLIPDFDAFFIQQCLSSMPLIFKRILFLEYIHMRPVQAREKRRELRKISAKDWDCYLHRALQVFWDRYCHKQKMPLPTDITQLKVDTSTLS